MNQNPIDAVRQRQIVSALRSVLPEACVLYREEDTRAYECDGLTLYRQLPMVVALPESETQLAQLLKLCHAERVPVVARGAGTGLAGSALPHAGGVLDRKSVV